MAKPTTRKSTPAAKPAVTPAEQYRPAANDVTALSAQLGASTEAEVRLLVEAYTDEELVEIGNDFATPRATADALRVCGVAASFLQKAPAADQRAVDLSLDVVRIGAWAAAEDARVHETFKVTTARERTAAAATQADAERVLTQARAEKTRLADTVRAVAQRASVNVAVGRALAPAANGAPSAGPEASLDLLVAEGRALLASDDPSTKRRVALYKLTAARLDDAAKLAREAKAAAGVIRSPRAVVTQGTVDWWDGAMYVILQTIVRAFQGGRATNPALPAVEFVSLRQRAAAGGDPKAQGSGTGGGGKPEGEGGGA